MESSGSSSDLNSVSSNFCFIPNILDFDISETEMTDKKCSDMTSLNMTNLFYCIPEASERFCSFNCKPDPDCIKMFVGQIPQTFNETDLLQMFEKFGKVYDLRILKDKTTGRSKGCCFVTFFTRKAALSAQNALHNIKVLPGMHHPIQMKPADIENRNDRKLFVGMLPRTFSENNVRNLFSPYGTIEECTVLRDASRQSKGCAFVTYLARQSAQNAVKSMHQCHTFDGCSSPMVVKFADTQKDKEIRKLHMLHSELYEQTPVPCVQQQLASDSLASFAAYNSLLQQIQNNGYVNTNSQLPILNHLNLPSMPTMNWNMVPILTNVQGLTNSYLLNQFNPLSLNDTINLNNFIAQLSGAISLGLIPQSYPENVYPCSSTSLEQHVGRHAWDNASVSQKQIEGPDGANLFIYHLPHEFTDQKLVELFNPYGKVISAKVFIDKVTKMSKCFGFVSYDNIHSAKAAIQNLNGYHILGKKLKVEVKKRK